MDITCNKDKPGFAKCWGMLGALGRLSSGAAEAATAKTGRFLGYLKKCSL